MADKKISALTTAASPLAGTEVLPIVQSGATVKVSVADLTQTQNNVAVATAKMAWSGPGHLDVPNDGGLFSKGVYNNIGSNWYYDNALRYNVTGAAGWYQQNAGFHVWYSAASGTAGSPIASFPETMALFPNGDLKLASGNVVIGTAGKGIVDSTGTTSLQFTSLQVVSNKTIIAPSFTTAAGETASTPTATPVTLFTPSGDGVWIVNALVTLTGAPAAYIASSMIKASGGVLAATAISTATNMSISVSGANVQATQTSGGNQVIAFSYIRLF